MTSAYGSIQSKRVASPYLEKLLPLSVGSHLYVCRVRDEHIPILRSTINHEISIGMSFPQSEEMDEEAFSKYYLSADCFVLINDRNECLGGFYGVFHSTHISIQKILTSPTLVKPNFPGHCSHISNGGFLVAVEYRGRGYGKILANAFLSIAPLLGYKASLFNLVFVDNIVSTRIWREAGFVEVGRIPRARDNTVDALIFYSDFATHPTSSKILEEERKFLAKS